MEEIIDARGLLCPEPVLLVKKKIDVLSKGKVCVRVNTAAARDNVSRLAQNKGWQVSVKEEGEEFLLILIKE